MEPKILVLIPRGTIDMHCISSQGQTKLLLTIYIDRSLRKMGTGMNPIKLHDHLQGKKKKVITASLQRQLL